MASPKLSAMRRWLSATTALSAAFSFVLSVSAQTPPPPSDQARVPVLVELFTSEGCSDCPPADRLLEELDTRQPIPGVQAIVLSEHVTYWNQQGWHDPFSLDEIDLRQKEYGDQFKIDSVYTPQAVVDGGAQLVGNNASGLQSAIQHAGAAPKKSLTIGEAHWDKGAVSFTVQGASDSGSKLLAVLAADATGQKIMHGENAGRTLHHVAVVRTIKEFGSGVLDGRALRLSAGGLSHDQASSPVRLVVFLVDRKRHVTAVAEQNLR
jgi:hypothetical protein